MNFNDNDGYPPEPDDDPMPPWADADAMIADMDKADDRLACFLIDNGREDEIVAGVPAFLYKALYLDKP